MFEAWGHFVYRHRRLVLLAGAVVMATAAVWGTGVFAHLQSGGGFTAPNSQISKSKKWMPMLVTMPPERSSEPFHDTSYQRPRAVQ